MKQKIQLAFIIMSSIIASLGTYPYAKDFSHTLFNNHPLSLLIASIFVPAAVSANIALGAYSISNSIEQSRESTFARNALVIVICSIAALSTGFLCFVGYYSKLPLTINIAMSTMVVLVNIGIGFSAINTALKDFSSKNRYRKISGSFIRNPVKFFLTLLIILSTLLVTLTAFLASTHGINMLLSHTNINPKTKPIITNTLALLIWTPTAVLFVNAAKTTFIKIYDSFSNRKIKLSFTSLIIILIAIASGSAYAQMALEFFDECKCIPEIFKKISTHYDFVFYGIMPLAFLVSASVNAYALTNLKKLAQNRRKKLLFLR